MVRLGHCGLGADGDDNDDSSFGGKWRAFADIVRALRLAPRSVVLLFPRRAQP